MKARDIQRKLMSWIRSSPSDIIIPSIFIDRFEADVFKINLNEYVTEYEIKISRQDFKNDFKKTDNSSGFSTSGMGKHEKIISGIGANRFYFVVPEGLVSREEIPRHCGLIYVGQGFNFSTIVSAPLIHREKCEQKLYRKICVSLSFREIQLRHKLYSIQKQK